MSGYGQDAAGGDGFERSREMFESLVSVLRDPARDGMDAYRSGGSVGGSGPGVAA